MNKEGKFDIKIWIVPERVNKFIPSFIIKKFIKPIKKYSGCTLDDLTISNVLENLDFKKSDTPLQAIVDITHIK